MHMPRPNPRQEYRLKQRDQIEASPLMTTKYPRLKALTVILEYFDSSGTTKNGEMKCKLNLDHARSALWFACPGGGCAGGDFDLSRPLAKAVAARHKLATGEMQCQGKR